MILWCDEIYERLHCIKKINQCLPSMDASKNQNFYFWLMCLFCSKMFMNNPRKNDEKINQKFSEETLKFSQTTYSYSIKLNTTKSP